MPTWSESDPAGPRVVAVTGGRRFADRELLFGALDALHRSHEILALAHGGAAGADSLAGAWARERGVQEVVFPANWRKFGRRAGPLRNIAMLQAANPSLLVAMPGGSGTAHCSSAASRMGIPVRTVA